MKESKSEALVWFGVRALSVYEVLGPPIQEFLDDYTSDGFREDWQGVESSIYLVAASTPDRAMDLVDEEYDTPDSVNVFGQTIRHRSLRFDVVEPFVHGLPVPATEECHEIFYEMWSTSADRDPLEFFEGRRPPPENAYGMIAPIALYEHRARYEELRGPLTASEKIARPTRKSCQMPFGPSPDGAGAAECGKHPPSADLPTL